MKNVPYIEDLFLQWQRDPSAVDSAWAEYFSRTPDHAADAKPASDDMAYKQGRVDSMVWSFRDIGYLYADLDPLGEGFGSGDDYEKPTAEQFGLSSQDMDTVFFAGPAVKSSRAPLREIIDALQETYCSHIGVEFLHIQDKRIRNWLIRKMEQARNRPELETPQKRIILEDLIRTEAMEQMLHRSFVGQKRFSLEGSEAIIPALHFLVDSADVYGIEDFVIGTTHRGRLAILNTILHMTPEEIFSRFEENFQDGMSSGGGDVKYHVGYETDHKLDNGGTTHISLAANSSHLESVDAIVQGKARALQDRKGDHDRKRVLPVLLHGDAAFSGQGVVLEVFNLSRLDGFTTGGTIHIIINNQIGFTTSARDARSSFFPTDTAKSLSVPIFHVNGDDPEALIHAAGLAMEFRQEFGADCVLDVVCFRRHGHNESDEPSFTNPQMYHLIDKHPGIPTIYGEHCAGIGVADQQEQESIKQQYFDTLAGALEDSRSQPVSHTSTTQGPDWDDISGEYSHKRIETGVSESTLVRIIEHVTTVPEGFHVHPILNRIMDRRRKAPQSGIDWSLAETLAAGTLLMDGTPVRLSGEDSVRGTFSQRHWTWWDIKSDQPSPYCPLRSLDDDQAALSVFDSPLSEYSVLGFEYGYSLTVPRTLVIWEAQFGDFANGAQVIIDNYLASAEHKWDCSSGLVLLLPHGCEGQGPDHSSGHPERFLQLAAQDNILVCNLTTPAQYFHALRRQVRADFRKPLVILTPKSLLRHPMVISPIEDLEKGSFQQILDDQCDPGKISRVLLCSGKVYYDLLAYRQDGGITDTALVRVEQLYPFPDREIGECIEKYSSMSNIAWVQEEPMNYGAWSFMRERFSMFFPHLSLQYSGRDESPSIATGSHKEHKHQQQQLVAGAFETGPETED